MATIKFDDDLNPIVETDEDEVQSVSMEQRGLLAGVDKISFGGLKIGSALVGGTTATILSDVVSGVVPQGDNIIGGVAKLATASFLVPALKGFLGDDAVRASQLFLTYDVVREILPLDNLVRGVTGVFGGRQLSFPPNTATPYNPQTEDMFNSGTGNLAGWASSVVRSS